MRRVIATVSVCATIALTIYFSSAGLHAELRTWTASSGGFTVDADFVQLLPGNVVRIKLPTGETRDVPLDKLSAADQEYVRTKTATPAPSTAGTTTTTPAAAGDRLARAQREAGRCRSAQDALRIYKIFAESPESTDAERAAVAAKIAELEPLAAQNLFRVGGKWLTEAEAEQIRKQATELMRQGLEVLKLGQEDTFRKKFADAAALEPEEIRADFTLAILYSSSNRNKNTTRAVQYYQACLKRDPTNLAVLNNLALMYLKTGEFNGALQMWKQAMALTPDQRICHNIGKLVKASAYQTVTISKGVLDQLTELYLSNIGDGKLKPTDPARGWLHLLVEDANLDLDLDKTTQRADGVPPPSNDGPVVGGGTGFAIDANHIVTNAHVVDGGTSFEIQLGNTSRTNTYKATVVAVSQKPDLAILRVETQFSNPVTIDPTPCRRGSDIMVLGYPEMFELGASLKATRGVISGLPSPALDNLYLYDAVTNGGNSGGPVCDAKGNVVAVHCIGVNTASRYGGGIPTAELMPFIQKSLPGFRAKPPASATIDWPGVDQNVSPATVLVWVRKRDGAATTEIAGALEDKSCLGCKGAGMTKCLNGGCVNGVMNVRIRGNNVKAPCPICRGTGSFPCLHCKGEGIDRDVKAAMASTASSVVSSPSPPTPNPGGAPGPRGGSTDPTSDPEQNHPPLPDATADLIKDAIANTKIDVPTVSRSGNPVSVVPPDGALLIGLDVSLVSDGNIDLINAIRPIFRSRKGKEPGNWIGKPTPKTFHIEAPSDYALSRFSTSGEYGAIQMLRASGRPLGQTGLLSNSRDLGRFGSEVSGRGYRSSSNEMDEFSIGIIVVIGSRGGVELIGDLDIITTVTARPVTPGSPITQAKPDYALTSKQPSATIPSDGNYRQPALNSELAEYIRQSIAAGKATDVGGDPRGNDVQYREVPPNGGVLIGFDISYDLFINTPYITAIRPIYITTKGKALGSILGTPGKNTIHIEAKTGYAVGRLFYRTGLYLNNISVTYMKLTPTGLDPKDRYESFCYGGGGSGSGTLVGGDNGDLIIGALGSMRSGGPARCIGGVVIPPLPAAVPAPAPAPGATPTGTTPPSPTQ